MSPTSPASLASASAADEEEMDETNSSAVEGSTLVGTSESETETSTLGLDGVEGLMPRKGLVLVAVDL